MFAVVYVSLYMVPESEIKNKEKEMDKTTSSENALENSRTEVFFLVTICLKTKVCKC